MAIKLNDYVALRIKHMSKAEIAQALGVSQQNLHYHLKNWGIVTADDELKAMQDFKTGNMPNEYGHGPKTNTVEWFDESTVLMTSPNVRINKFGIVINTSAVQMVKDMRYMRIGFDQERRHLRLDFNNDSGIAVNTTKSHPFYTVRNAKLRTWLAQKGIGLQTCELVPDGEHQFYALIKGGRATAND